MTSPRSGETEASPSLAALCRSRADFACSVGPTRVGARSGRQSIQADSADRHDRRAARETQMTARAVNDRFRDARRRRLSPSNARSEPVLPRRRSGAQERAAGSAGRVERIKSRFSSFSRRDPLVRPKTRSSDASQCPRSRSKAARRRQSREGTRRCSAQSRLQRPLRPARSSPEPARHGRHRGRSARRPRRAGVGSQFAPRYARGAGRPRGHLRLQRPSSGAGADDPATARRRGLCACFRAHRR